MGINRYTVKAQEALQAAQSLAVRNNNKQVDVEHLLAALLEQEQGLATAILRKTAINLDSLKRRIDAEIQRLPKVSGAAGSPEQVYVTARLNRLLSTAEDEA